MFGSSLAYRSLGRCDVTRTPSKQVGTGDRPHFGAGDRLRSGCLDFGKVALYQLSYTRIEVILRSCQERNLRPTELDRCASPVTIDATNVALGDLSFDAVPGVSRH